MKKFWKRNLALLAALAVGAAAGAHIWQAAEQERQIQQEIAGQVIRFHVLANSDRRSDQAVKLQVRDRLLNSMGELLADADGLDETRECLTANLERLRSEAEEAVRAAGSEDAVTVKLTEAGFPVRTYGDYTFPAGTYETLQVVIGNGKGHNWWCLIYPSLCLADALHPVMTEKGGKKLKYVLSDEAYDSILQKDEISIGFLWF